MLFYDFRRLRVAYEKLEAYKLKGHTHEEAANLVSIELAAASDAHCRAFLVESSMKVIGVEAKNVSQAFGDVLRDLVELFAVDTCLKSLADIIRVSTISCFNFEGIFQTFIDLI